MESGGSPTLVFKTLVHALATTLTLSLTEHSVMRVTMNGEMLAQVELFQDKQERLQ